MGFSLGGLGNPCCCTPGNCEIKTEWCGCALPFNTNVTVAYNSNGTVVATGAAPLMFTPPTNSTYMMTASFNTNGYLTTPTILNLHTNCNGVGAIVQVYPASLTCSDNIGNVVTLLPTNPSISFCLGSDSQFYTGEITYSFPGSACCPSASVTMDFCLSLCQGAPNIATLTVTTGNVPAAFPQDACPGNPFTTSISTPINLTGAAPGASPCLPVSLSGSADSFDVVYGSCAFPPTNGTASVTITQ
jgi:hypothetical protein